MKVEMILKINRKKLLNYGCIVSLLILSACQNNNVKTIGELSYQKSDLKEEKIENMSYEEVRQEYRELAHLFDDQVLKEKIQRRISDVYMMESDYQFDAQAQPESHYSEAIKSYQSILEKYPNSPENAEVFYQLAKAYDLEGNPSKALEMLTKLVEYHPNYKNLIEAKFRIADIHYNNEAYEKAESAYFDVAKSKNQKLSLNAYYMLGWVHYKQQHYIQSIESFGVVLNKIFMVEKVDNRLVTEDRMARLDQVEKPMVDDCVHSMSLALNKIGGVEAMHELPNIANAPYIWLVYDRLGGYYLEKELFEAAVNTWQFYLTQYSESDRAPYFHEKIIDAYKKGQFHDLAFQEKRRYIDAYGIRSNRFTVDNRPASVLSKLNLYLEELARYRYNQGQSLVSELEKLAENKKYKKKGIQLREDIHEKFLMSADLYAQYLETFKNDPKEAEYSFYMAEAYFQAEYYVEAAKAYEKVAYELRPNKQREASKKNAVNAGYAAIIAYQHYIDLLNENLLQKGDSKRIEQEIDEYQRAALESMLRFSKNYDDDPRAPAVLTSAADYLFHLEQYQEAIDRVTHLLKENQKDAGQTRLDAQLVATAYGIQAHSYYKLDQFEFAADSYIKQRSLTVEGSNEFQKISKKIAASLFKQAEKQEARHEIDNAVVTLLSIKQWAPDVALRVQAQHDAVALLLQMEKWHAAILELLELEKNYPQHELAIEFNRKLAFAYENNKNLNQAAQYYLKLHHNETEITFKSEALFKAAMLYEKLEDFDAAIVHFKTYAHRYEQPFITRMEARYHLAKNYLIQKKMGKHIYWLRRIIAAEEKAKGESTDRSRWLAAWAHMQYGHYEVSQFNSIRLRHPIGKYIPKKHEFFQLAIERYQNAASFGFLEMVTESSYRLGILHQTFARDILRSRPPSGLNKSQLAQYTSILQKQAEPLKQLASELHQANIDRAWNNEYSDWIKQSFIEMKTLQPDRYNKTEKLVDYGEGLL